MSSRCWKFVLALAPVVALLWHAGPGQGQLAQDRVGRLVHAGEAAARAEQWPMALAAYQEALALLPDDAASEISRIRLACARAATQSGEILAAGEQLEKLLAELSQAPGQDVYLINETRHELATNRYYAAWLLRLDGATPEEWQPEAERARQQFRLLSQEFGERGAADLAETSTRNLEAVIRLEEMDLSQLMARPLPKQCPKNCSGLCKKKRKNASLARQACQNPGEGQRQPPEQDARRELKRSRGAGLNSRHGEGS